MRPAYDYDVKFRVHRILADLSSFTLPSLAGPKGSWRQSADAPRLLSGFRTP
jgi:hypothetical protein